MRKLEASKYHPKTYSLKSAINTRIPLLKSNFDLFTMSTTSMSNIITNSISSSTSNHAHRREFTYFFSNDERDFSSSVFVTPSSNHNRDHDRSRSRSRSYEDDAYHYQQHRGSSLRHTSPNGDRPHNRSSRDWPDRERKLRCEEQEQRLRERQLHGRAKHYIHMSRRIQVVS